MFLMPMSEFYCHHGLKGLDCATYSLVKDRVRDSTRFTNEKQTITLG
jgi:hypothetical protein